MVVNVCRVLNIHGSEYSRNVNMLPIFAGMADF